MRTRQLWESFNCSFEGLIHAFRTQRNMRLHFLAAAMVLILSLWIPLNKMEVLILFFTIALVLMAEMFNTAIETAIDLITQEYHPLAKVAKNVAAGAVLIASVNAMVVGYLIFYPRLDQRIPLVVTAVRRSPAYLTLAIMILITAAVIAIKTWAGKGRPLSGGMPSGHSAISFGLSTAILLFSREAFLGFLAYGSSFLVAQSRYEGKIHTLWEIVAGSVLGILATVLVFQIFLP